MGFFRDKIDDLKEIPLWAFICLGIGTFFWVVCLYSQYQHGNAGHIILRILAPLWSPTSDPVLNVLIDAILLVSVIALMILMLVTGVYLIIALIWLLLVMLGIALLAWLASISVTGAILSSAIAIGAIVWIVKDITSQKGHGVSRSDSGLQSSPDSSKLNGQDNQTQWPWRDNEVVIGQKNVYRKGLFGGSKIGHIKESFWGEKSIHKKGLLFSDEIAKVKEDFFGNPKAILDEDGNEVGEIKTTWTGKKIIVDKDGEELGEYKK